MTAARSWVNNAENDPAPTKGMRRVFHGSGFEGLEHDVLQVPGDREYFVSWSIDDTVKVWDRTTGELLRNLAGNGSMVICAATTMLHDEPVILTGTSSGTIKIWHLATGQCLHTMTGHTDYVDDIQFVTMPDGTQLAVTTSEDTDLRVWDLVTGTCLQTFTEHQIPTEFFDLGTLPDGTTLVISDCSLAGLKVWDVSTGVCRYTFAQDGETFFKTFPGDNTTLMLTYGAEYELRIRDLATGTLIRTLTHNQQRPTAYRNRTIGERQYLIVGNEYGVTRVWDLQNGTWLATLKRHQGRMRFVDLGLVDDQVRVVTVGEGQVVKIWDLATKTLISATTPDQKDLQRAPFNQFPDLAELLYPQNPDENHPGLTHGHTSFDQYLPALLPDGNTAIITGGFGPELLIWDAATGAREHLITLPGATAPKTTAPDATAPDQTFECFDTYTSPNGRTLLCAGTTTGTIGVWDLRTGQLQQTITGPPTRISHLSTAALPDGATGAVTASADGFLRVWDLTVGQLINTVDLTAAIAKQDVHTITSVTLTATNARIIAVTTTDTNTTAVWDLKTGTRICGLLVPAGCGVNPLVTVGNHPWPLASHKTNPQHMVSAITQQCPDFAWAHTESSVGTPEVGIAHLTCVSHQHPFVQIWDVTTGTLVGALTDYGSADACASNVTIAGRELTVMSSGNGPVSVWDFENRQCVTTYTGHNSYVTKVATTTLHGEAIAVTASYGGPLHLWRLTDATFVGIISGWEWVPDV